MPKHLRAAIGHQRRRAARLVACRPGPCRRSARCRPSHVSITPGSAGIVLPSGTDAGPAIRSGRRAIAAIAGQQAVGSMRCWIRPPAVHVQHRRDGCQRHLATDHAHVHAACRDQACTAACRASPVRAASMQQQRRAAHRLGARAGCPCPNQRGRLGRGGLGCRSRGFRGSSQRERAATTMRSRSRLCVPISACFPPGNGTIPSVASHQAAPASSESAATIRWSTSVVTRQRYLRSPASPRRRSRFARHHAARARGRRAAARGLAPPRRPRARSRRLSAIARGRH